MLNRYGLFYEQKDNLRAEYGDQTLKQLSKELTNEFGRKWNGLMEEDDLLIKYHAKDFTSNLIQEIEVA